MDPKIGKMVLWGQLLGCGKSALKVTTSSPPKHDALPSAFAQRSWHSFRAHAVCLCVLITQVGCGMAYRDPFVLPLSSEQKNRAEKAKQELADGTMSDHLALVNALNHYEKVRTAPWPASSRSDTHSLAALSVLLFALPD